MDAKAEDNTVFPFLELPPELQLSVLTLSADSEREVWIQPGYRIAYCTHGLNLVCKRIHKDFRVIVWETSVSSADYIIGDVTDFDYSGLTTWLNRVEKRADLGALDKTRRHLGIDYRVTAAWSKKPDLDNVIGWFKYVDNKRKRHRTFNFTNSVSSVSDMALTKTVLNDFTRGVGFNQTPWHQIMSAFKNWYEIEETGELSEVAEARENKRKYLLERGKMYLDHEGSCVSDYDHLLALWPGWDRFKKK